MSDGAERGHVWIESTRGPDDEPVCKVTFGPDQGYAPVADVRATALDLITCAAYAEMMITLVTRAGLPADVVSSFATDLLAGQGRTFFGARSTMTMLPAGSTKRREAVVLLKRGGEEGMVSAAAARVMALAWLSVAEATESDQFVSAAMAAAGIRADTQAALFAWMHQRRSDEGAPGR